MSDKTENYCPITSVLACYVNLIPNSVSLIPYNAPWFSHSSDRRPRAEINVQVDLTQWCDKEYVLHSIRHFTNFCAHNFILNRCLPQRLNLKLLLLSSSETLKMCKSLKKGEQTYIRKAQKKARIGLPSSKRNNNIKVHLRHDMYQSPYYRDHSWVSMIPVMTTVVSVRQPVTTVPARR